MHIAKFLVWASLHKLVLSIIMCVRIDIMWNGLSNVNTSYN